MLKKNITKLNKNIYGHGIYIFALIASLYFLSLVKIDFYSTTVKSNSFSQTIAFPFLDQHPSKQEKFEIITHFFYTNLKSHTFQIIPDDCVESIQINDNIIDLTPYNRAQLCDYKNGFKLNLKKYLLHGTNTLTFTIADYGGARGMNIKEINGYQNYIYLLILLIIFIYTVKFLLYFNIEKRVIFIFILGLILKLYYLSYTEFNIRTHDIEGHIEYIKYIANNFQTPSVDACWQCYHQPLYYILSAIVYKITTYINLGSPNISLQYFSLFLNTIFLIYSILILKIFIKNKNLLLLFSSLMIFFPSLIIHSIRIGNDSLFYLFHIMAIYYFLKWVINNENKKFIYLALVSALFAIFVKSNGILTFGIIGLSYLFFIIKHKLFMTHIKITILSVISFILVLALNLEVNKIRDAKDFALVSNSNGLTHELSVDSSVNSFIYVNLDTFLSTPYANPWKDGSGRNHFWHYLLKTSLFGEFDFVKQLDSYAKIISFIYIFILLFIFLGFLLIKQKDIDIYIVLIFNLFILIMGMIYLRISVPFSCSSDFRYVLPILLSFTLFYYNFTTYIFESDKVLLKFFVFSLLGFFALLSIVFFVVLGLNQ